MPQVLKSAQVPAEVGRFKTRTEDTPACVDMVDVRSVILRCLFDRFLQANDGGLIQNLVRMTSTPLLSEDFEIMLPINQVSMHT